jgi:hypothetical protein
MTSSHSIVGPQPPALSEPILCAREPATKSTHSDLALILPASTECETLFGTSPKGTSADPLSGDERFEASRDEEELFEPAASRLGVLLGPVCHMPSCRGFCDSSAKADCRVVASLQREITIHRGSVTHSEQEKYGVPMARLGRGGHEKSARTSRESSTMARNSSSKA